MILWHLLNSNANKSSMFTGPKAGICFHFSVLVSTGRKQLRHELVFFFISPARCVVTRIETVSALAAILQAWRSLTGLRLQCSSVLHACVGNAYGMCCASTLLVIQFLSRLLSSMNMNGTNWLLQSAVPSDADGFGWCAWTLRMNPDERAESFANEKRRNRLPLFLTLQWTSCVALYRSVLDFF